MFTGIVDGQGVVKKIQKKGQNFRLTLQVPRVYARLKSGFSVSVDGVCLTVTDRCAAPLQLTFDVVPETLNRTHFRYLKTGDKLNLERPLKWTGRVHGHLVQGHVDGVAKVLKNGPKRSFQLGFPKKYGRAIVEKGSVALNGVSLTVGRVRSKNFSVYLIPFTLTVTTFKGKRAGDWMNIETDILAKYFLGKRKGRR